MNKSKDTNPDTVVGIKLEIGFSTQESYRQLYGNRKILEYLAELVPFPVRNYLKTDNRQNLRYQSNAQAILIRPR